MPVVVECPTQLSSQDLQDLQRIYADAPLEWALSPESVGIWLAAAVEKQQLIVGRFNGRLLGACRLREQEEALYLSHLCVRAVTRKRGVGRRIWDEVLHRAAAREQKLYLTAPDVPDEARLIPTNLPLRDLL